MASKQNTLNATPQIPINHIHHSNSGLDLHASFPRFFNRQATSPPILHQFIPQPTNYLHQSIKLNHSAHQHQKSVFQGQLQYMIENLDKLMNQQKQWISDIIRVDKKKQKILDLMKVDLQLQQREHELLVIENQRLKQYSPSKTPYKFLN